MYHQVGGSSMEHFSELVVMNSMLDCELQHYQNLIKEKNDENSKYKTLLANNKNKLEQLEKAIQLAHEREERAKSNMDSHRNSRLISEGLVLSMKQDLQISQDKREETKRTHEKIIEKYYQIFSSYQETYTNLPWSQKANEVRIEVKNAKIQLSLLKHAYATTKKKITLFEKINESRVKVAILNLAKVMVERSSAEEDINNIESEITDYKNKLEALKNKKIKIQEKIDLKVKAALAETRDRVVNSEKYYGNTTPLPTVPPPDSSSAKGSIFSRLGISGPLILKRPPTVDLLSLAQKFPRISAACSSIPDYVWKMKEKGKEISQENYLGSVGQKPAQENINKQPLNCFASKYATKINAIKDKESSSKIAAVKEKESSSTTAAVKEKESSSTTAAVKEKESSSTTAAVKEKESSSTTAAVKEKESSSTTAAVKEKESSAVKKPIGVNFVKTTLKDTAFKNAHIGPQVTTVPNKSKQSSKPQKPVKESANELLMKKTACKNTPNVASRATATEEKEHAPSETLKFVGKNDSGVKHVTFSQELAVSSFSVTPEPPFGGLSPILSSEDNDCVPEENRENKKKQKKKIKKAPRKALTNIEKSVKFLDKEKTKKENKRTAPLKTSKNETDVARNADSDKIPDEPFIFNKNNAEKESPIQEIDVNKSYASEDAGNLADFSIDTDSVLSLNFGGESRNDFSDRNSPDFLLQKPQGYCFSPPYGQSGGHEKPSEGKPPGGFLGSLFSSGNNENPEGETSSFSDFFGSTPSKKDSSTKSFFQLF